MRVGVVRKAAGVLASIFGVGVLALFADALLKGVFVLNLPDGVKHTLFLASLAGVIFFGVILKRLERLNAERKLTSKETVQALLLAVGLSILVIYM